MDPKIRELLGKIKASAVEAGRTASRVANELIEQAKLNYRIMELNSSIEAAYKNIGRMLYEIHAGEDVSNECIDEELAMIDGLNAEISDLREALKKAKSGKVCSECGNSIGKSDIYCPACGSRVKQPEGGYSYSCDADAAQDCGCGCDVDDVNAEDSCCETAEDCCCEAGEK